MRCYFPFNTDLYYQCSNELALIKSKHYFQVSKIFCFIARVSLIKGKENTFFAYSTNSDCMLWWNCRRFHSTHDTNKSLFDFDQLL